MTTNETSQRKGVIWLRANDLPGLQQVFEQSDVCGADERILSAEKAGEGNMNRVLRVTTNRRQLILKQSRPWVAKYPQIAAPVDRVLMEIRFYEAIRPWASLAGRMPKMLAAVADQYTIVLEDLTDAVDGTYLYRVADDDGAGEGAAAEQILPSLVQWLADLHRSASSLKPSSQFANLELRQLNHAHIFQIPLAPQPALDLDTITPGLEQVAEAWRGDRQLTARCEALGQLYLSPGTTLVHGDFFPGSWLVRDQRVWVIDPEFGYWGRPEFDLAVLVAHLRMARFSEDQIQGWLGQYEAGGGVGYDQSLVQAWAAVEVIRRLLGVAQLPLTLDLDEKRQLLEQAVAALRRP